MKVLVFFSCILAVAFGWEHLAVGYHGPQHIPVIHKGVPIETPEVQHAKAAHFAALAQASQHRSHSEGYDFGEQSFDHYGGGNAGHDHTYGFAVQHGYDQSGYQHQVSSPQVPAYQTSHIKPQIGHDGKPLDTPEVEIAKAKHFAAVHEAIARTASHSAHGAHYRKRRGIESYELGHYESPQVHFDFNQDGHGESFAQGGHEVSFVQGHYEVPALDFQHGGQGQEVSTHTNEHGYTLHQEHAQQYSHGYYTHEEPQIGHDGKPLDTAEVEQAKLAHIAAHYQAKIRNALAKQGVVSHEGPVDTPEVQHAKALHFAAHAAAKVHSHNY